MVSTKESQYPVPSLRQIWQLPLLLVGIAVLGVGLYLSRPKDMREHYRDRLDLVGQLIDGRQYDRAVEELKWLGDRLPQPQEYEANRGLWSSYLLYLGDVTYLSVRARQGVGSGHYQGVIQSYVRARDVLEVKLEPLRLARLADSYMQVGENEKALGLLEQVGEGAAVLRQELLKKMVDVAMEQRPVDEEMVAAVGELLDKLFMEPELTAANRGWATERKARLLVLRGEPAGQEEAVAMLLQRLGLWMGDASAPSQVSLLVTLGEAYLALGETGSAAAVLMQALEAFRRGDKVLEPGDPLVDQGRVELGLARVDAARGNLSEALGRLDDAVSQYVRTPLHLAAHLERGVVLMQMGDLKRALESFHEAVVLVRKDRQVDPVQARRLQEQLLQLHDSRQVSGDYEMALAALEEIRQLQEGRASGLSSEVLQKLAKVHEKLAEMHETSDLPVAMDHHRQAAEWFEGYAHSVAAKDDDSYGQGLWGAADHYDRAGLHKQAIRSFVEYVRGRPSDPQRLEAMFRLAELHRADGQLDQAIELYEQIIREHPKSPQAVHSFLPLARSYRDRGPQFADQAESVLLRVVEDRETDGRPFVVRPDGPEFRQALLELGHLYYGRDRDGDAARSVERFEEGLRRFPLEQPEPVLLYRLADAYKKSVLPLDRQLSGAQPPSVRDRLLAERQDRLLKGQKYFDAVVQAMEARVSDKLDALEQMYLRNSYFFRADCAYQLKKYDGPAGAIELYARAAQRFHADPSKLVALIQIVNCYSDLGRWDEARTQNERAREALRSIPEEAFTDPDHPLPMSRQHWQRWLESTSRLASTELRGIDR